MKKLLGFILLWFSYPFESKVVIKTEWHKRILHRLDTDFYKETNKDLASLVRIKEENRSTHFIINSDPLSFIGILRLRLHYSRILSMCWLLLPRTRIQMHIIL